MIPSAFEYVRLSSVDEAVEALGEYGDDAKLLAGGHSLVPLMKLRLANPSVLLDLDRVSDLRGIREVDGEIRIGALTTHHELATSSVIASYAPLLGHAASKLGDPQVRHRGTIGGSLAHGDPAGDLCAVLLSMRGAVVVTGPNGEREIAADELFTGFLETSIAAREVLTEVRIPSAAGAGWSFQKLSRRALDWAIVGCAVQGRRSGSADSVGVALVNMGSTPMRAWAVERAIESGRSSSEAAESASEETAPPDDLGGSAEFRRHLARVLVRRGLDEASEWSVSQVP